MIATDEIQVNKDVDVLFNDFINNCPRCRAKEVDIKNIRKAFEIAKKVHANTFRKSGEPYILHPLEVAKIATNEIGLGPSAAISAFLHEVIEISDFTIDDIENHFGKKIAYIVRGLTKIPDSSANEAIIKAENFRRLLLTLSDDVRVILIKLADRLHNMRTIQALPRESQIRVAGETLDLYSPLAHRLGLYAVKTELEDLCFKSLQPFKYVEISKKLEMNQKKMQHLINRFALILSNELENKKITFDISGRTKSIYSIWKKMETKKVPFEEIYDILAIRIIFEPKQNESEDIQCWNIYTVLSKLFPIKRDRLRDWISSPKDNGYEALHVTVLGPDNEWIEVQIRSRRMHEIAERGVAAHWKYKGDSSKETIPDKWIKKVNDALENPSSDALEFLDTFKMNLFASEILIFTPKGEIFTLPQNSTVLDFAFAVHTDLGKTCIGAQIGKKIVPLNHILQSGDRVKVLSSENAQPKQEWLDFAITPKAKNAIRGYLNKNKKSKSERGKESLQNLMNELDIIPNSLIFKNLLNAFNCRNKNSLYASIGSGKIPEDELIVALKKSQKDRLMTFWRLKVNKKLGLSGAKKKEKPKARPETAVKIKDVVYEQAPCCHPVPGDEVIGYQVNSDKIIVHRSRCQHIHRQIRNHPGKIVLVKWTSIKMASFLTSIRITGIDRKDMIHRISHTISKDLDVNMKNLVYENDNGIFEVKTDLYVHTIEDLNNLIMNLTKIEGIKIVERIDS
jgi:GTP diphosphokinase / guanosine-3',5'-bis(diphosphate) 3'-diphosphatase